MRASWVLTLLGACRGVPLEQADIRRALKAGSLKLLCSESIESIPDVPFAELPSSIAALAMLLIVLARDSDLRYERIYVHLQDDVTRKRPMLALVPNLLSRDVKGMACRTHFHGFGGRLVPHGAIDDDDWLSLGV
ncbi:MAG: hypothetical protein JSR64_11065 [Nitrospira sp.]|nr:hypothetical protein [Nitrospira sp.]MBX3337179.1 hypothetical protein [Nitrospira sp.]MCW5780189.1 hypothetical protein [Nitrospira sp.]